MTLTLEPELARLLDRTGYAWPDADEDQLMAMARGWGGLGDRLEQVRIDHRLAAGAILEGNSGLAVAAFGDWAKVPIIGEVAAAGIEGTVGDLLDKARLLIGKNGAEGRP